MTEYESNYCQKCSIRFAQKDLIPIRATAFMFEGQQIRLLKGYKDLFNKTDWHKLVDPKICRACSVSIRQLYIKTKGRPALCSECKQYSSQLYTSNAKFLLDGKKIALLEICRTGGENSLLWCHLCAEKLIKHHFNMKLFQKVATTPPTLAPRPIVIRKVTDGPTNRHDNVLELNLCLNCFKPGSVNTMTDMRATRVTINDKDIEILECFRFYTKRAIDETSSQTKQLICLECLAIILESYESQHQVIKVESETEQEIKVEPVESVEIDCSQTDEFSYLELDKSVKADIDEYQAPVNPITEPPSAPKTDVRSDQPVVDMLTKLPLGFQYKCKRCGYLSLDYSVMKKHIDHHEMEHSSGLIDHNIGLHNTSPSNTIDNASGVVARKRKSVDLNKKSRKRKGDNSQPTNMKMHKTNGTKIDNTTCAHCKLNLSKQILEVHKELLHSNISKQYADLLNHNLEAYTNDGTRVSNFLDDVVQIGYYKCSQCGPLFKKFLHYKQHIFTVHKLYINKKRVHPYTKASLKQGLAAYKTGLSLDEIRAMYNIPKTKMQKYFENDKMISEHQVFTSAQETQLATIIRESARNFFDMSYASIKSLAYDFAESYGVAQKFSFHENLAGKRWLYDIKERNPQIADVENVGLFSDRLLEIVKQHNLTAAQIYNMDTCSFGQVNKKWQRVYSGKNVAVTLVAGFSASGKYLKPMVILKAYRRPNLTVSDENVIDFNKTGSFNPHIFNKWLAHFVQETRPKATKKVLLLLESQAVNLTAWNFAKSQNVILLSLPATNFCLQPVDLAFFEAVESSFLVFVESWQQENDRLQKMPMQQLEQRLTAAHIQKTSRNAAVAGFKDCGFWPIDKTVIDELSDICQLECPHCLTTLPSEMAYKYHIKFHGIDPNNLKCPKCSNRKFFNNTQLERHIWLYHKMDYRCKYCNVTMDRSAFRLHNCCYQCHHCGHGVALKSSLLEHLMVCRKQDEMLPITPKMSKVRPKRTSSIRCEKCQLAFRGLRQLNLHIEAEHLHMYECAYCSKKFTSKKGIVLHLKTKMTIHRCLMKK